MESVEAEGGEVTRRRRRKLSSTERNVIIGVATVAGLGLVGKLVAVLRREKPKRKKDEDVQTLESVLSGDEAEKTNLPLQARVQRAKLANLDNDEPDHEVVSRKRNPRRSKYADSFSEIVSDDDVTNDGEVYVNQDPVGRRGHSSETNALTTARKSKPVPSTEGGLNIKGVSHGGPNHHDEPGGRRRSRDGEGKHHDEDGSESPPNRPRKEFSKQESGKKESTHKTDSSEKKPRRTSTGEGRKSKSSGEEKGERRRLKAVPESSDAKEVKEVIFDEAGRWESVNGYKVLKATTSKIPTFAESMHKLEADGSSVHEDEHLVREFERERAETEKAQRIWDGKVHLKKKHATEGSEAYLQIKSAVVSSVAGTVETPEGVKVREVVKRSTLLPIPSGDESEVHSSVYNVQETEKGLKVEEVVTRTKLLPAKGDFALSDQQLLRTTFRKKSVRRHALVLVLRIVAVLVTLISVLFLFYSRKRIPLPFFH